MSGARLHTSTARMQPLILSARRQLQQAGSWNHLSLVSFPIFVLGFWNTSPTSALIRQELYIALTFCITYCYNFFKNIFNTADFSYSKFQTPPPLFSTGMLLLIALPFIGVGASATSLRLPHIFKINMQSRMVNNKRLKLKKKEKGRLSPR